MIWLLKGGRNESENRHWDVCSCSLTQWPRRCIVTVFLRKIGSGVQFQAKTMRKTSSQCCKRFSAACQILPKDEEQLLCPKTAAEALAQIFIASWDGRNRSREISQRKPLIIPWQTDCYVWQPVLFILLSASIWAPLQLYLHFLIEQLFARD